MSPRNSNVEIHERDIEIGILRGLDWSVPEIADHLGISVKGIEQRLYGKWKERIRRFEVIARTASAKKIGEIESKADVKAKIHRNAYKVIDKAIEQALEPSKVALKNGAPVLDAAGNQILVPVEVTLVHLEAVEQGLDRIEGKAVDRKAILERRELVNIRQVDEGALGRILEQADYLNQLRGGQALLPAPGQAQADDAEEAEIVEPPN